MPESLRTPVRFLINLLYLKLDYTLFGTNFDLSTKLALHFLLTATYPLTTYIVNLDKRYVILTLVFMGFLGPIGIILATISRGFFLIYSKSKGSIKDLFAAIFPESEFNASRALYERIVHNLDEYNPNFHPFPFMDVINFGTEKQKRMAIEKMLRFYDPVFSPALKKALVDSENSVRVLAATAINTLDKIYFQKYLKLEREGDYLALARHCYEYCKSKILDEDRYKKILKRCIELYEEILNQTPDDPEALSHLSELYLEEESPEKSIWILEHFVNSGYLMTSSMVKSYMSALYSQKEYTALREFAINKKGMAADVATMPELKNLLLLWGGGV